MMLDLCLEWDGEKARASGKYLEAFYINEILSYITSIVIVEKSKIMDKKLYSLSYIR